MKLHAKMVKRIIGSLETIAYVFIIFLQQLDIGAGGQLKSLEIPHDFKCLLLNLFIFIVHLCLVHFGEGVFALCRN